MTAARQERKSRRRRLVIGGLSAGVVAAMFAGASAPTFAPALAAATTERVVVDRHSGLAISGFDPVAYFTESAAQLGRPEMEARFAGVVWRFRNEGNRAAFLANPEVFMPRFGGYDAISVGRGASAPGHPQLWQVTAQRLYLFFSEADRAAFLADPGRAIEAAERHWPAVREGLVP
jgi:hypothetical protein